jgi:hypothetical protein
MGEISAASTEQANGVAQVGEAVHHMDQTTQQNAALVEEMAAAASSLKSQAGELVQAVAAFKLSAGDYVSGGGLPKAATRATTPAAKPFQGSERRETGIPKGAAARSPTAPRPAASAPRLAAKPAAAQTTAKATPAGGDDEWETF